MRPFLSRAAPSALVVCLGAIGLSAAASPAVAVGTTPRVVIEHSNPFYAVYGVDNRGVSYGVSGDLTNQNLLYASDDQARTWTPLYYFPVGSRIVLVRPLGHSTLLAGVLFGEYRLWRSTDDGHSWSQVFTFPKHLGLLTPHSIATDGHGRVYMAAYNYFKDPGDHRTPILRSTDDGGTWKVVHVVDTSRHAHCTAYDPYTGDVYVCLGDWGPQNQILRSTDRGQTWSVFIRGWADRAVDIAFDRKYVYFGQDNRDRDAILRADKKTGATSIVLANSLGSSYSALRLASGTFLIGETHEPSGSIYVGERTVHLYASRDGSSWTDVLTRPIHPDGAGSAYIDAYYQYPDGSVPLLISGYGTVVVRVGPPFPSNLASAHTPVSPATGITRVAAPAAAASGSAFGGLKVALTILLFVMAFLMLATAFGVRRLSFDRGPVAFGSLVIQPAQLAAVGASLFVAAIVTALIA
ncbi:MAG: WD40/YVTN/BNR-like repeat-containing protein [Gaiellaceae bacterium]